ncbi:MAG: hypothetical protein COV70_00805 [Parcubacteria group bacterium CG11_big_fil_rev_8_21_14_0_20_39_22]|nr:MAG: hypothetical protein COV70_00805 [Parcubacteria group bacterium CG11_big_fil_rev_8_21_14_0_20_39_22]
MTNNPKKILISTLIATVFIGLGFFVYFGARDYIQGPVIRLSVGRYEPPTEKDVFTVEGNTRNIAFITLNGNPIFTDDNGYFKEQLLLAPGYNIITVEAKDRFGRIKKKAFDLVHIPRSPTVSTETATTTAILRDNRLSASTDSI